MNEESQHGPLLLTKEPLAPASRLNRLIPFFLAFLLILSVVPMFVYPDPAFYQWINSPVVNGYYWMIDAAIFIVFALIVWQKNHAEIPLRYGLMFLWALFFTIIVAFIHESPIAYPDAQGALQPFGLPSFYHLIYEAETLYDLFFCFAFLFLWSYSKKEPQFKNVVPYLAVLLASASLIYAFIKGPDPSASYLTYTSFFKSNEDLGKVLFAGAFSSAVLAFDHKDWRRYLFALVGIGFLVLTGLLGLAITFWGLVVASFVVGIYVLLDQKAKSPLLWGGALIFVLLIVVFVSLIAIPSSLADTLRVHFGNELAFMLKTRIKLWSNYLNSLSSWRIFLGAGPMGYYQAGVYEGNLVFTPLQNGILEVYNGGGLVYLMFYFLVVIVGLFRFKKSEEKNPTFFAVVIAFTCAFLLFTIISNERLFFSSHFLSFFVAYIFMCYPHNKDRLVDET